MQFSLEIGVWFLAESNLTIMRIRFLLEETYLEGAALGWEGVQSFHCKD